MHSSHKGWLFAVVFIIVIGLLIAVFMSAPSKKAEIADENQVAVEQQVEAQDEGMITEEEAIPQENLSEEAATATDAANTEEVSEAATETVAPGV